LTQYNADFKLLISFIKTYCKLRILLFSIVNVLSRNVFDQFPKIALTSDITLNIIRAMISPNKLIIKDWRIEYENENLVVITFCYDAVCLFQPSVTCVQN